MLVIGQSLLGMMFIILTGYLLSSDRSKINWRAVLGAFGIQLTIGALVLYFPPGIQALEAIAGVVTSVLGYAQAGMDFMFGDFASGNHGFVFALQVLPIIVFFASLVAVLYHLGIMERLVSLIGGFIQFVLGTSKAESMSAATNIFIGQSEAPIATAQLNNLGKVDTPDGDPPTPNGSRDWLLVDFSQEQFGALYRLRLEWQLAERDGWDAEIYDY